VAIEHATIEQLGIAEGGSAAHPGHCGYSRIDPKDMAIIFGLGGWRKTMIDRLNRLSGCRVRNIETTAFAAETGKQKINERSPCIGIERSVVHGCLERA
jgi:hypothetical protein